MHAMLQNGFVFPFAKSPNASDGGVYRPITLTSWFAKTLVLNRIRPAINPQLDTSQAGFRWGSDVQMYASYETLRLRQNCRTFYAFLDINKAFDVAWRDGAVMKLHRAGTLADFGTVSLCSRVQRLRLIRNSKCGNWRWTGSCVEQFFLCTHQWTCSKYQQCVPKRGMWRGLPCYVMPRACKSSCGRITSNQFRMGECILPHVSSYTYLGVTLHQRLSWTRRVDELLRRGECKMAACTSWTNAANLPVSFDERIFQAYVRPSPCSGC